MKIRELNAKHEFYDADHWDTLESLAEGGKRFKKKLDKFLPMNPNEPGGRYACRKKEAHYTSYMGSIVNLYVSWLFSAQFTCKANKRPDGQPVDAPGASYADFQADCGNETTLANFVKDRFRQAMKTSCAYWLAERASDGGDPPQTMLEYEQRGLNKVTLRELHPCDLFDWECDSDGKLIWAKVYTAYDERANWATAGKLRTEIWRFYDSENVTEYRVTYDKSKRPHADETVKASPPVSHGFKRVPVGKLCVPNELCVAEMTADPQLEHFRLSNGMSWAVRQTCYAMPILATEDADTPARMGAGYFLQIGVDDKFSWSAPPTAPFDVLQKNIDAKRDEIYRIVHQMAQGLDNNAETVGRSAESKEIDAAATRLLLNEYGTYVSRALEDTLELISEAIGDTDYEWSVEGFSGYDTATVASLLENAKAAKLLGIPSETFEREIATKAALALVPELSSRVKDAIRTEIKNFKFTVSEETVEEAKIGLMASKAEFNKAKASESLTPAKPPAPSK